MANARTPRPPAVEAAERAIADRLEQAVEEAVGTRVAQMLQEADAFDREAHSVVDAARENLAAAQSELQSARLAHRRAKVKGIRQRTREERVPGAEEVVPQPDAAVPSAEVFATLTSQLQAAIVLAGEKHAAARERRREMASYCLASQEHERDAIAQLGPEWHALTTALTKAKASEGLGEND